MDEITQALAEYIAILMQEGLGPTALAEALLTDETSPLRPLISYPQ